MVTEQMRYIALGLAFMLFVGFFGFCIGSALWMAYTFAGPWVIPPVVVAMAWVIGGTVE